MPKPSMESLGEFGIPDGYEVATNYADPMSVRSKFMYDQATTGVEYALGHGADLSGLTFPSPADVDFVRFVNYQDGLSDFVACVNEKGWAVEDSGNGGYAEDPSWSLQPDYLLATYECYGMYPDNWQAAAPLGETQYRRIFEYYGSTIVPCLDEAGFAQQVDIPSFDSWYAGQKDGSLANYWDPWLGATADLPASMDEVEAACPYALSPDELYAP